MANLSREDAHGEIIRVIRSLNVESGQTLRQVQVPDDAYLIARSFLKWATNLTVGPNNTGVACRFKVLYWISQNENIYDLLMFDAGNTPLCDARQKIDDWKDASKSLLRYALNLKLAPKRPEFQRMKLSSSYYVYQVAKKLRGAEKILLCMGYAPVTTTSTNEIQELKYGGEVNTERVVYTAADLVILHSELERITDLVTGAEQSNFRNVILRDILKARSEPEDTLDSTLRRALSWSLERIRQERGQVARPALYHHLSQAPTLPPHGAYHQQPSSNMAQLPLPVALGGHSSLQHQGQYLEDISSGGRRSSAPTVQANLSEHRARAPPPSPLFQSRGGEQSAAPPNSKDQYNKIDKTIDKSRIGINSVGPRNTPDTCDTFIPDICDTVVSPTSKGGSIPFDPMNLPEPPFDTHDLEMLHQEARTPADSYTSDYKGMQQLHIQELERQLIELQANNLALQKALQQQQSASSSKITQLEEDLQKEKELSAQLSTQLSETNAENTLLISAQQESIAFGIEPWKVPRSAVEIENVIGGGGWGVVNAGKLQVAVKQFYPTILSERNLVRLKREMRMLALIRHPNLLQFIAAVFDENEDHRRNPPYIITELLDMSLRSAYENNLLPRSSLLPIFMDTARALDYLHRRHEAIIHRDVSSANVLLKCHPNDKWVAKLSDLGSANLAQKAYTMNEGARVYLAPEAFTSSTDARSAGTLTPKVDVYSYGIVLCEVATSTFPEQAALPAMLVRVQSEWHQLHELIVACTKPEPTQRPLMDSILTSLEQFPPQQ